MSRFRNFVVSLGVIGLLVVGLAFGLGPVVRAKASEVASRWGVALQIDGVRPTWGGVGLFGVRLSSEGVHIFDARLDEVRVDLDWGGGVRGIAATGATVKLEGKPGDIAAWLRSARPEIASREARPANANGRTMSVEGIEVTWSGATPGGVLRVEGGQIARKVTGEASIGAREIAFSDDRLGVEIKNLALQLVNKAGRVGIREGDAARVDVELSMDGSSMATDTEPGGEVAIAARVGDAEERSVPELHRDLIKVAGLLAEHIAHDGRIGSEGLHARIHHNGQAVHIGPARARLVREANALVAEIIAGEGGGGSPLNLHASVPVGAGEIAVKLQGGPVTLASLGAHDGDFGLLGADRATVDGRGEVVLSEDAATLSFDAEGRLRSFGLMDRRLADEPIETMELGWRAKGEMKTDRSTLLINEGEISLGAIRLQFGGLLEREAEAKRGRMTWTMPVASCQQMLSSLPRALVPRTADLEVRGSFAMTGRLGFDTQKLEALELDWNVTDACHIASVPAELSVHRFRKPFRRMVYDGNGNKVEVVSGPGTSSWTPIEGISPFVPAAVMTTEDGRFYRHHGFDKEAIKSSAQDNIRAGRFVRGASTISMQLAKNLYLDREKTLSRKLQEVILTAYLEQELTKDEIMELYLNIVELGPMVYGIGPAAEHYFDTTAHDLSLGQALYLISTLPNPKRQYFAADGRVSDRWSGYLQKLMHLMLARHRITERELADGLSEIVTYRVAQSPRREGFIEAPGDTEEEPGWPLFEEP